MNDDKVKTLSTPDIEALAAAIGWATDSNAEHADPDLPNDPTYFASAVIQKLDDSGWQLIHMTSSTRIYEVGPGEEFVRVRMDRDAEVDTLAAIVGLLEREYLEPDERSRIALYLADRYTDAVTTEVER